MCVCVCVCVLVCVCVCVCCVVLCCVVLCCVWLFMVWVDLGDRVLHCVFVRVRVFVGAVCGLCAAAVLFTTTGLSITSAVCWAMGGWLYDITHTIKVEETN